MENSPPTDRISNLPDELLSHILSFLPTKLAFTTTLLSKRFTPLFKLLTTLHFDDESVRDEESLLHLCRWFETVKLHPAENLQIHISHILLPPSIFIFPNLVLLELNFVDVTASNISVDLPSLKTLRLYAVQFKSKRNFNNIVCGCPVLEHLLASHVYYYTEQAEGITVSTEEFKSLSKLITADINAFDVPFGAISNVKTLRFWMKKRLQEIDSYHGGFPVFRNLIDLNIGFSKFHHWDDVVGVLQYCPKLQILSIFKVAINEHLSINWKYPNSVLECISSHLRSCTINYEGWEDELQFTKYILQNARLLQVMKINICHSLYQEPNLHPLEELYSYPMISPQCKLSIEW